MIDLYLTSVTVCMRERKEKAMCTFCMEKAHEQTIHTLVALTLPTGIWKCYHKTFEQQTSMGFHELGYFTLLVAFLLL